MEAEKKGGKVEEDKEEGVKGIPIEIWREGKIWKRGEEKEEEDGFKIRRRKKGGGAWEEEE